MSTALTDGGPAPTPARRNRLLIGLAAVTLAGAVVRAIPLALSDFPVNDGGLFVAMTRAIEAAGWALPDSVAWNGSSIPFAYPPLAFYVAGALESVLGADLFDVFRWLPLLASVLIAPAVYLLARELLRSDLGGLLAAVTYALTPVSYVWLVQGGGVTRSPGLLLAVLALWQTVALVREPTRSRVVIVGLLAGMTALVHPGAAVFAASGGALIWLFEGRTRRSLVLAAGALALALVVVAPWAITVVSRHGLSVLTDVPSNGPSLGAAILALGAGRVTGQAFVDPLAILGVALAVLFAIRRQFLLPLWLLVATAISYQYGMVPFALIVGTFGIDLVVARERARTSEAGPKARSSARRAPTIAIIALSACLVVEAAGSMVAVLNPGAPLHALTNDRRDAMAWVTAELAPDSRIAVVTDSGWAGDPDSEWFPLLTGRTSVGTVQGSEWLGATGFEAQVQAYRDLQACVQPAWASCVHDWMSQRSTDYVYLPKGPLHGPKSSADCCADLRAELAADARFAIVYDEAGASVFRLVDGSAAAP
jgi:hypothetical protein